MGEEHDAHGHRSVKIRSPSKIVFLYPTLLVAILAGVWTMISSHGGSLQEISPVPGQLFWWTFVINLLVLAFDFSRGEFFALVLFFGVVVLGVVLINQNWHFVTPLRDALSSVKLIAHPHFYFMISLALGGIFVAVFFYTRFDYWEITHNELLHHHGLLGNVERFPAPDLRMTKEITDVFEYVLMGSGRLVIQPRGAIRATVLENVPFVNRKEEHIQRMLSTLSVTVDTHAHQAPAATPPPAAEG
jgi:hypothetical protein